MATTYENMFDGLRNPQKPAQTAPLNQLMTGNIQRGADPNNANAYTRTVNRATETTAGQLEGLLRGDNPLLQRAARKGATLAQLRGSTGNDSLFAGAAQDAMAEQLIPVAGADAGVYERGAVTNQGALNESSITDRNNATSRANASTAASASRYGAELGLQGELARLRSSDNQFNISQGNINRQFEADQRAFAENTRRYENDNQIRAQERTQNRAWETADRDTATRAAGRNQIFSNVTSAIFSDPTYWRDPAGASGMVNFFTNNFSGIWDQLFPPTQP
jgi:hypothetical protein